MGFRDAFRQLSFPVSILINQGKGLTINSLHSFSLQPNLLSFNLYHKSPVLPLFEFDIYCLQSHHIHIAQHYAKSRHLINMPEDTIHFKCTSIHHCVIKDHVFIIAEPTTTRLVKPFKSLQYVHSQYL